MIGKEILLIINPEASKGKGRKKAQIVCSCLEKDNISYTIAYTNGKGHAEKLAKNGANNGFKTIVAVGGDGTVNEVINGIMRSDNRSKVKMGIIPIGRGNDFAWVCGITSNIKKSVNRVIKGEAKPTDVGFCYGPDKPSGMYFLNGAGFGFEPMVNFKAMEYKHLNGMPSYVAAFLYILKNITDGSKVKLKFDGNEKDLSTQQISVASGIRMGSTFKMTPLAKIDDGKLDLMFTNRVYRGLALLSLVFSFLRGAQVKDKKNFSYYQVKEVEIESEKADLPVHLDGEVYSKKAKRVTVKVIPGAIKLLR